jgi:hypothetical protein
MTGNEGIDRRPSVILRLGRFLTAAASLAVGVVGFCAGMILLNGRQVIYAGSPTGSDIVIGLSLVTASGAAGGWGVRVVSGWVLRLFFDTEGLWLPVLLGVGCWLLALTAAIIDLVRSNP